MNLNLSLHDIVTVAGQCHNPHCRAVMIACARCVVTVAIDPMTGLPPDVAVTADGRAVQQPVDPAAAARAVQAMVCDTCVERSNLLRPASQRVSTHRQNHSEHLRLLNYALN